MDDNGSNFICGDWVIRMQCCFSSQRVEIEKRWNVIISLSIFDFGFFGKETNKKVTIF